VTFPFRSFFFSLFPSTSDKINLLLTLSIACEKILDFSRVTFTSNANFRELKTQQNSEKLCNLVIVKILFTFLAFYMEGKFSNLQINCAPFFYFSCHFLPIAFHNIYSKHIERFGKIIKRFNLSIFIGERKIGNFY
jgi:hypothetical protein